MTDEDVVDILASMVRRLKKLANRANAATCHGHPEFHGIESGCHRDIATMVNLSCQTASYRRNWLRMEGPKIMKWANEYYKRVNKVI